MKNTFKLFTCVLMLATGFSVAQTDSVQGAPNRGRTLEVSFGSTLLFLEQDIVEKGEIEKATLPVSSVLLITQWLFHESLSLPVLINIPVEPFRKFENGEMVEEHVTSTAGIGLNWKVISFQSFQQARTSLELSGLIFADINPIEDHTFYVLPNLRLHIETRDGFTLYAGGTYIPGRNITALMYGVGHQF